MSTVQIAKKKYSVKADTKVFSYCNLTFRQIIILIWCWQQKCSIGETIKIAGVSYPTVRKVASALSSFPEAF